MHMYANLKIHMCIFFLRRCGKRSGSRSLLLPRLSYYPPLPKMATRIGGMAGLCRCCLFLRIPNVI